MWKFKIIVLSLAVFLFCVPAYAHPNHSTVVPAGGLIAGLAHPFLGLDHLLAMLGVGLLSPQMGSRWWWVLPSAFVLAMISGGIVGMRGVELSAVEVGISASVLVIGVALLWGKRLPVVASVVAVMLFGLTHGHAHGTEMPAIASPSLYAAGFVCSTAASHLAGVAMAHAAGRRARIVLQLSGATISLAGLSLWIVR